MDELDALARDYGLRPQGKSNPMRSEGADRRSASVRSSSHFFDDHNNREGLLFDDVFGGPPKYTANNSTSNNNTKSSSVNNFDYGSLFSSPAASVSNESRSNNNSKTSSLPVYDKPVYDDDIFDGLPGIKSKSVSAGIFEDDAFVPVASPPQRNSTSHDQDDDLLGKLGRNETNNNHRSSGLEGLDDFLGTLGGNERVAERKSTNNKSSSLRGFDDLLGGFGSSSPAIGNRSASESSHAPKPSGGFSPSSSNMMDDPFVVFGSTKPTGSSAHVVFTDPLEDIDKLHKSRSTKSDTPSASGGAFDDLDPLNGFSKSARPFSPENSNRGRNESPSRSGSNMSTQTSASREQIRKSSHIYPESHLQRNVPDSILESSLFDMPTTDSQRSTLQNASSPPHVGSHVNETSSQTNMSPRPEEQVQPSDDVWLTVSEIPLFTQPTCAPPPSRPPPVIPRQKSEAGFFSSNVRKKSDEFTSPSSYSSYAQSSRPENSQVDELEDFAMGRTQDTFEETNIHSSEDMNASSVAAASAAAMKEAMDRAEAKFRHAKEVREREYAKAARSKEVGPVEGDEQAMQDAQERELRENKEKLERQRRQKEEEEKEQRRLDREREKARQAVERATREARERAAAEALGRATAEARLKTERAAVERAQAEARERAERAAVQRAQAEARERAAAEARDRAEKAAADARERANAEAREKEAREKAAVERAAAEARRRAERAAVDRAAAEARERAAAEARERAAARSNQQKNDNDLESFFSMGARPSSAPRPRATSTDTMFDTQFQSTGGPNGAKPTSGGSSSNMRKASSATNIVDDLSSIFGGPPSSGEFQEVEGETEERRRARMERHHRTQERAAKALAEKNQRDLQALKEQEERHRIAETLDIEIKRWSAGKEGNLRALLSTLQYVLWPECGWQPVSLTDLITGASVKKVYRKATLCIHPDKVQQKGASLQQKYIAEKVFDLLKEAWNKFNSEELF